MSEEKAVSERAAREGAFMTSSQGEEREREGEREKEEGEGGREKGEGGREKGEEKQRGKGCVLVRNFGVRIATYVHQEVNTAQLAKNLQVYFQVSTL